MNIKKVNPSAFSSPNAILHYTQNFNLPENSDIGIELKQNTVGLKSLVEEQRELLIEYNEKLIEHGYGMSKQELFKKDRINIIPLCRYSQNKTALKYNEKITIPIVDAKDIDDEFYNNNYWYLYIPCFSEGVLRINIGRYIYWKVITIDIDHDQMEIYLQDYISDNGLWQVGVSGYVTCHFNMNNTSTAQYTIRDARIFSIIYCMIPYTELGWNTHQIEIWESIVIPYALDCEKKLAEKGTDNVGELLRLFFHFISLANQELAANKPKAVREKKGKDAKAKRTYVKEGTDIPRKIIRNVGRITMQSEKPPRMPSHDTVVHYKTAVWKCRGGVRRLKSGKLVPFKESIKRRKCLTQNGEVPQTIINIK